MHQAHKSEAGRLLSLAWPQIIGQASNVGMSFVDTVMAGRLSALDLAGVAIGSVFWNSLMLFLVGVLLTVPAFISNYDGAGRRSEMASFVRQAAWVALGLSAVLIVLVLQARPVLSAVGVEGEVIPQAGGYLDGIVWGAPAMASYLVLRMLCDGLGRPRPTMYIGILGMALNVPADYVLMYGKLGFPALGAHGCGLATAVVWWTQLLVILVYLNRARAYRFLELFSRWELPRAAPIKEILTIGIPIGTAIFVESSLFMVATLLMGSLGATAVAGHQIALNFSALMFMVPLGISLAITVRVGNAAGRDDRPQVRFRGQVGLGIVLATQSISAALIFLFPAAIAGLYTADGAVIETAVALLLFAAIFQVPDGVQIAAASALRGIKDTRIPLLLMIFAYWVIGIPLSYWLGIQLGRQGEGIWIGMIAGLTVAAVLLSRRFFRLTR